MLKCLKEIMKCIEVWLPISRIQSSMPQSFIDSGHEDNTCIFDDTEVSLERSKKQRARAQTYSSYKANNTVKFLMVIAPDGFFNVRVPRVRRPRLRQVHSEALRSPRVPRAK
ncbi:hypothetical protein HPB48_017331 [Haemaphysalis longicornis]|uniref:DDE Tnp4 domain-containing protein n=1 Tax=Haemaphysalis longicornis TaxID=44386 RepID=A0A9J6H1G0_HAELO|nr:hypothetical protein HPB48_017331 [Haemaphysalis longicornis]